jgi:hypothetical protein
MSLVSWGDQCWVFHICYKYSITHKTYFLRNVSLSDVIVPGGLWTLHFPNSTVVVVVMVVVTDAATAGVRSSRNFTRCKSGYQDSLSLTQLLVTIYSKGMSRLRLPLWS